MCDQVYNVIFKAKNFQIKSTGIGDIVVEVVRIDNNVYVLKEKTKRRFLSKIGESWLWHKKLGHMSFDQIVKLSKKKTVKDAQAFKTREYYLKILPTGKENLSSIKGQR